MIINSSKSLKLLEIRLALDILHLYAQKKPTLAHRKLLDLCKNGDLKLINEKIKDFPEYKEYIPNTSTKKFIQDSTDLLNELFEQKHISEVSLNNIALIFSEHPVPLYEYEEEPEKNTYSHLTENIQGHLDKLELLLKNSNPRTMSISQFKNFSKQFKKLTKQFGISKFQQYFLRKASKNN